MLKISNLSLKIKNKSILQNINISFEKNKITAIVGKNASGKTTLIKCINGIYKYDGVILLKNQNINNISIKELSKQISILPQLLKYPHMLVKDIIAMGRNPYLGINSKLSKNDLEIISKTINKLNIYNILDEYLDELSGGQRQLIYLALQLIQDAPLMIFDEPSSFMDVNYETYFLKTIKELKEKDDKTMIIVMHNINQVIKYADNIIVIDEGKIVFQGTINECIKNEVIEKVFNLKKYKFENIVLFEN